MDYSERQVYWSIYCESTTWQYVPVQHIISCHYDATFDQLLNEVKRVTSKDRVKSFSYAVNDRLKNVIINDNESMKLAIGATGEKAFDVKKGGVSIHLNEYPRYTTLTCAILFTFVVYIWLLLWSFSCFIDSIEQRTYITDKDNHLIMLEYTSKR